MGARPPTTGTTYYGDTPPPHQAFNDALAGLLADFENELEKAEEAKAKTT